MHDYSKGPLRGKGLAKQEEMRKYLGAQMPPKGETAYDFVKGKIKFEYKFSKLLPTNENSSTRHIRAPTMRWSFANLRGHGGKKVFDHLILEGSENLILKDTDSEDTPSCYFYISSEELSASPFGDKNTFTVTLPRLRGKSSRLRGVSRYVWDHELTKEVLKAKVDRLVLAINGEGDLPEEGIHGRKGNPNGEKDKSETARSKPARRGQRAGGGVTFQLGFPFEE